MVNPPHASTPCVAPPWLHPVPSVRGGRPEAGRENYVPAGAGPEIRIFPDPVAAPGRHGGDRQ